MWNKYLTSKSLIVGFVLSLKFVYWWSDDLFAFDCTIWRFVACARAARTGRACSVPAWASPCVLALPFLSVFFLFLSIVVLSRYTAAVAVCEVFFVFFHFFFLPLAILWYVYISDDVYMHLLCACIYRMIVHAFFSLFWFVFIYATCPRNSKSCIEIVKTHIDGCDVSSKFQSIWFVSINFVQFFDRGCFVPRVRCHSSVIHFTAHHTVRLSFLGRFSWSFFCVVVEDKCCLYKLNRQSNL